MKHMIRILTLTAAITGAMAGAAQARDWGHHPYERNNGVTYNNYNTPRTTYNAPRRETVVINNNDRGRIHDYLGRHFHRDPHVVVRRHYVGEVVTVRQPMTIWDDLAALLSPPPAGYQYVQMDQQVLLVDGHGRVVDVVE